MNRIALLALAALATSAGVTACATASGPVAQQGVSTVRVQGVGAFQVRHDDQSISKIVALPLDQVWRALPAVFDSLEVPVGRADSVAHVFGNDGVRVRRKIGGVAISRYFDCGTTQIGPNADSYDILLVLLITLKPGTANTTTVTIKAEASARPVARSQPYATCSSNATFDVRFVDLLKRQAMR